MFKILSCHWSEAQCPKIWPKYFVQHSQIRVEQFLEPFLILLQSHEQSRVVELTEATKATVRNETGTF